MIMEKAGASLNRIFALKSAGGGRGLQPIKALHVGLKLFRKSAILHDAGIVHGDITKKNILLSSPSGIRNLNFVTVDFVFVDWDRSFVESCSADIVFQLGPYDDFDTDHVGIGSTAGMPEEAKGRGSKIIDVRRLFGVIKSLIDPIVAPGQEFWQQWFSTANLTPTLAINEMTSLENDLQREALEATVVVKRLDNIIDLYAANFS